MLRNSFKWVVFVGLVVLTSAPAPAAWNIDWIENGRIIEFKLEQFTTEILLRCFPALFGANHCFQWKPQHLKLFSMKMTKTSEQLINGNGNRLQFPENTAYFEYKIDLSLQSGAFINTKIRLATGILRTIANPNAPRGCELQVDFVDPPLSPLLATAMDAAVNGLSNPLGDVIMDMWLSWTTHGRSTREPKPLQGILNNVIHSIEGICTPKYGNSCKLKYYSFGAEPVSNKKMRIGLVFEFFDNDRPMEEYLSVTYCFDTSKLMALSVVNWDSEVESKKFYYTSERLTPKVVIPQKWVTLEADTSVANSLPDLDPFNNWYDCSEDSELKKQIKSNVCILENSAWDNVEISLITQYRSPDQDHSQVSKIWNQDIVFYMIQVRFRDSLTLRYYTAIVFINQQESTLLSLQVTRSNVFTPVPLLPFTAWTHCAPLAKLFTSDVADNVLSSIKQSFEKNTQLAQIGSYSMENFKFLADLKLNELVFESSRPATVDETLFGETFYVVKVKPAIKNQASFFARLVSSKGTFKVMFYCRTQLFAMKAVPQITTIHKLFRVWVPLTEVGAKSIKSPAFVDFFKFWDTAKTNGIFPIVLNQIQKKWGSMRVPQTAESVTTAYSLKPNPFQLALKTLQEYSFTFQDSDTLFVVTMSYQFDSNSSKLYFTCALKPEIASIASKSIHCWIDEFFASEDEAKDFL